MDKQKEIKDYTYEEAVCELENILAKMENGEVPLDESMDNFEKGMRLTARCEEILNSYERRIVKIIEERNNQTGEIKEEIFNE